MKSMLAASILALPLAACSHAGPSDAEVNQAFANYGWARVGLSDAATNKVHAHDCSADSHDSTIYICQITIDGMSGSKATVPFKKADDRSWTVNL